jgi:hypothetical protein
MNPRCWNFRRLGEKSKFKLVVYPTSKWFFPGWMRYWVSFFWLVLTYFHELFSNQNVFQNVDVRWKSRIREPRNILKEIQYFWYRFWRLHARLLVRWNNLTCNSKSFGKFQHTCIKVRRFLNLSITTFNRIIGFRTCLQSDRGKVRIPLEHWQNSRNLVGWRKIQMIILQKFNENLHRSTRSTTTIQWDTPRTETSATSLSGLKSRRESDASHSNGSSKTSIQISNFQKLIEI